MNNCVTIAVESKFKQSRRNFSGFNGIRTPGLCVCAGVLYQLSYADPYTGGRPIYWVHQPVKGMKHRMKWCELQKYKWHEHVAIAVESQFKQSRRSLKKIFWGLSLMNSLSDGLSTDRSADWLTGQIADSDWLDNWLVNLLLTDWLLTDWFIKLDDWLNGWLTNWLTEWLSVWSTYSLTNWLAGWLTDWLTGWLIHWSTNCMTDGTVDWPTEWLSNFLTAWMSHWLAIVDWLLLCAELVGNRGGLNQIEPNDYNFIPPSQLVFSDFNGQALLAPNVRIWFLIHYIPPFLR